MKRAPLRSLLFVPADSPRKIDKGLASAADAVILDLEDAVAESRKAEARAAVAAVLAQRGAAAAGQAGPAIWVRVNAWMSGTTLHDLAACVRPGLAGVLLPKAANLADVQRLAHALDALEAREGMAAGSVAVIPVVTELAAAVLRAATFAEPAARVTGYIWGAEDLSADLGAAERADADGQWSFVYRHARSQCLLAAVAAGVTPIDTLHTDYRDHDGLQRACDESRRDGFRAKVAIHPDQVETINRSFSPSQREIAEAQAVVAAFAAQPDAGVVGMHGRMVDRPHLELARKLLEQRAQEEHRTGDDEL